MPTEEEIINEGFSLHQTGRFEEAETCYKQALSLSSENAEVCNLLGVLKLQQNDVDSAIEWVEKAIQISSDAYFYETLFQAFIRGKFYEKITEMESVINEKFSDNYSLLFNLALAYKK